MTRVARAIVLALTGCSAADAPMPDTGVGSASTSTSTSTSAASTSAASSSTSRGELGPPVVFDLGASAESLGPGEQATITAFVQHPRGDAAIVEGVLLGPGEPESYGAFVREVNGRWSLEIGWDDVDERMDLSFERELVVELVARFVDDAGLAGEATIGFPLQCTPLAAHACDGECVDRATSAMHCGTCDHACASQRSELGVPVGGCSDGACAPLWSACLDPLAHRSCAAACVALGSRCVESGCAGRTILPVADEAACGRAIEGSGAADPDTCGAGLSGPFVRCCCAQP